MHFVNELLKYVEPEIEDEPPDTISGQEADQSLEVPQPCSQWNKNIERVSEREREML
jgi:hypothetical protein